MDSGKRYTRFCGIDVAKNKHVLCIIDRDGKTVVKSRSFMNTQDGYQQLMGCLKEVGQKRTLLTGMEATAHYWYSLHDFLQRHGYETAILNPIQTAQQAKKSIRKCKTDKHDAVHIATLLKNGEYKAALVPDELGMTCRQLTRLRYRLIEQTSSLKQLIWSRLHPIWPEYESIFKDPFCASGRKLLYIAPAPVDILNLGRKELSDLIRSTSRGKYGQDQTDKIWHAATTSVGMSRGLEGARLCIQTLLEQIEAIVPIREKLEEQIRQCATHLPAYIFSLPAINPLNAASLFGEIDPIENFKTSAQLVAFAGLDLSVFQTGQYDAPRRHISKRGSPFLRYTLWSMAFHAVYHEGDLRNYWLRKCAAGLTHRAAVTAVAIKLCHVIWRILIDKRDYLPQGRPD